MEARCYYSGALDDGHWLKQFRNSVLRVATAALELRVDSLLTDAAPKALRSIVAPVFTRGGKAIRMGTLQNKYLLRRLSRTGEQHNSIANTLCSHDGYASVIANVRAAQYHVAAREVMKASTRMSWSWDGATYGGLSVNVALCLSVNVPMVACHCAPVVSGGLNAFAQRPPAVSFSLN